MNAHNYRNYGDDVAARYIRETEERLLDPIPWTGNRRGFEKHVREIASKFSAFDIREMRRRWRALERGEALPGRRIEREPKGIDASAGIRLLKGRKKRGGGTHLGIIRIRTR